MTNDDFLGRLRADWQRQQIDVRGLAARVSARERRTRIVAAFNIGVIMAMAACSFGFAIAALREGDALYGVAALAFLVAAPAVLFEVLDLRRMGRLRYEDSPAGMLRQARDQAVAIRRQLRSCRIAALLLIAASLAAWVLVPAGLADRQVVLTVTGIWAATALASWLWQLWRDRRLGAEIAGYERLETQDDDED